jgi:hypothetical protein
LHGSSILGSIISSHKIPTLPKLLHIQVSSGDQPHMAGVETSCTAGAEVSCIAGDGDVLYGRR